MLSLGIRYLCGWAMATHPADHESAEWPPHPDRVFMALAAAHFETLGPPDERAALEWLESQPPPMLATPDASRRRVVTSFVPVNDVSTPRSKKITSAIVEQGRALLPEHRPRQARQFPVSIPHTGGAGEFPTTFVIWPDADVPVTVRQHVETLCRKVTRVGHSASLVQMWVSGSHPEPTHAPNASASLRLRVPAPGRLRELESFYAAGRRPSPSMWSGYGKPAAKEQVSFEKSTFDDSLLVFKRVDGTRLGLRSTLLVTAALRGLVMKHGPQPCPEWISGHRADGTPTDMAHLAFVPLAEVGHPHAEGRLLGVAVVVPRHASAQLATLLEHLYQRQEEAQRHDKAAFQMHDGNFFEWQADLALSADRAWSLRPSTWCGTPEQPATTWASVTPIVLDRFPKRDGDKEEAVALACERIGLPTPVDVIAHSVSSFRGVPTSSEFPAVPFKSGAPRRVQTHAILRFPTPVLGPVLLGAGRHRGYGFCRPFREHEVLS